MRIVPTLKKPQWTVGLLISAVLALLPQIVVAQEPCLPKSQLPAITGSVTRVSSDAQLQSAVQNAQSGTTILLSPGIYTLSSTLYVRQDNISIRGDGDTCDQVALVGRGMDNSNYGSVPHGVWSDAENLALMNLTIRDVYYHGIVLNSGAQTPKIISVQVLDTGQQLVKANPTSYGVGVNNGVVQHSRFAYTNGTPATDHGAGIGYTNGVDVHAGEGWNISNNRFENFHTPDSSAWLWNPAVLMWNGARGTVVEANIFVNVDRAIAFGLMERSGSYDHSGGVIRNNMVYMQPGLYSANRKYGSDGTIIVWNSPGTVVAHNTVHANGNLNRSIEFRFDTTGASAINNLTDVAIGSRNSAVFAQSGNFSAATGAMFRDPASGNLRLVSSAASAIDKVSRTPHALKDIDGNARGEGVTVDIGAHEYGAQSPPMPPINIRGTAVDS